MGADEGASSRSSAALGVDTDFGAFSVDGPWNLDLDDITWLAGVDSLRTRVRNHVPELTRPRRLPPGRRVATIMTTFGWALARWKLKRHHDQTASRTDLSIRLRLASEKLGTTYIKLAQIISSGEGIFPPELVSEFAKCRDQVPAETWDTVRSIVEADLGRTIDEAFTAFDQTPLAAASIAQVHVATLRNPDGTDGPEVVVKVQRPAVDATVHGDIAASAWLAPFLVGRIPVAALANPPALVEVFAQSIVEELDFRLEAQNMLDVAQSLHQLDQTGYVVPRPHPRLVTRRVLVMERLHGFQFDDLARMQAEGIDPHDIVRTGMIGFLEGALVNGIFHGDLHGGNLFVQPDGTTALLDYGIVGRLTESKRVSFLKLLMASTSNNVRGQVEAIRDLGALPHDVDIETVIADLGLDGGGVDPTTLSQAELVGEVNRLVKAMLGYGARMPRELMLFAKNLVFLDGVISTLTPDLDLFAEVSEIAMWFVRRHGNQLAADVGIKVDTFEIDLTAMKNQFGVDPATDGFTYRELQDRRELITRRFTGRDDVDRLGPHLHGGR